ncbi:hypothetical protein F7725_025147 [Dissostichus mawsoni]|uniref:Transmembrane protein n=1 Tax=Dissostichus mawsoni TaxID=36200 RepID=A0A7J5XAT2_DISMA|nr:hypothetical protein F7725_025147 [Dissostichus mawsoni]
MWDNSPGHGRCVYPANHPEHAEPTEVLSTFLLGQELRVESAEQKGAVSLDEGGEEGEDTVDRETDEKRLAAAYPAHVLLSAGQDEPHHKDLYAVCHECQPQHKVKGPLELPVTTLFAGTHRARSSSQAAFARFSPRDSLVLALIDLIILIVTLCGVTVAALLVIGRLAVSAVIASVLAPCWG